MSRPTHEQSNDTVYRYFSNYLGQNTTTIRSFLGFSRDYNGVNTPSYYQLAQAKNGLPINNHDSYVISERKELTFLRTFDNLGHQWTSTIDTFKGHFPTSNFADHSVDCAHSSLAYEQAKSRCIASVKNLTVNAAQAVAEIQQTANLVGDTAHRLANAYLAIKHGKFKQGFKALGLPKGSKSLNPRRSAADNWLALQYGWLPLLSDIDGACKQLAKRPRPPYYTVTGTSTSNDSALIYDQPSVGGGGLKWFQLGYTSKARMSLTFCVQNHAVKTMSELGISDPLLLAWELLPYSFVVDWFLPVGKYLESINYTDGLTFVSGYTVQYSTCSWSATTKKFVSAGGGQTVIYYPGPTHSSNVRYLSRRKLSAAPSPSLPKLKNPLSFTHMANGLALLSKAFR